LPTTKLRIEQEFEKVAADDLAAPQPHRLQFVLAQ